MSDFQTATLTSGPLDPYKRVKYSMGLVLGVDEFDQEQVYLMERDRLHNRALHGYGTIRGLDVSVQDNAEGPEVRISPGLAVNPQGQTIHVPSAQCAQLNAWLAQNQDQVRERLGAPPSHLTLSVVLCYRECETDMVPIPGGPCRSQEDSLAASRLADAFELSLRFDPPAQVEEDLVRRFGQLLGQIEITAESESFVTREEMEDLVRGLAEGLGSPPLSSPPWADVSLRLHPDQACDILRAAFRVWVTEVRPALLAEGRGEGTETTGLPEEPSDSSNVLLAQLDFDVNAAWQVEGLVTLSDDDRPVLLHTRLLQEWLLCGRLSRAAGVGTTNTFATLFALSPTTIRAWIHHPELLTIPPGTVSVEVDDGPRQRVTDIQPVRETNVFDLELLELDESLPYGGRVTVGFNAGSIRERTSPDRTLLATLEEQEYAYLDRDGNTLFAYLTVNLPALNDLSDVNAPRPADDEVLIRQGEQWVTARLAHRALDNLANDDHQQYLRVDGRRALTGDLSADGNRITNLAQATADGDAVRFEQAIKVGDTANGDLRERYPAAIVAGLQGRPVSDSDPAIDNVLTWDSSRWRPHPVLPFPFVTITLLDGNNLFEIWFNIDAPENNAQIGGFPVDSLSVFRETETVPTFLESIRFGLEPSPNRNVFRVRLERLADRLRFRFNINDITLSSGETVARYAGDIGIRFLGQRENFVTAFVRARGLIR